MSSNFSFAFAFAFAYPLACLDVSQLACRCSSSGGRIKRDALPGIGFQTNIKTYRETSVCPPRGLSSHGLHLPSSSINFQEIVGNENRRSRKPTKHTFFLIFLISVAKINKFNLQTGKPRFNLPLS